MKRFQTAIVLVVSLVLTACSTMRVVDTDVSAFSAWTAAPPGPGTRFKFERLPSQQATTVQQERIEALATTSLSKVGMALSPQDPTYSVQVLLVTEITPSYPEPTGAFGGTGVSIGGGSFGTSIGLSFPIGFSNPYFKRTLSVLIRELSSQKVVFETRALHRGSASDAYAVLPAMLDSALLGFPQPPAGMRRINVEVPR